MLWGLFTVAFSFFSVQVIDTPQRKCLSPYSSQKQTLLLLFQAFIYFLLTHPSCVIEAMTAYVMHADRSHNNPVFKARRFNLLTQKRLNRILRNLL